MDLNQSFFSIDSGNGNESFFDSLDSIENNNDIELEALLDKVNTTLLMTNPLKTSKQSR